jgi:hypothetical protein
VINITDDPDPETIAYTTIITEQVPSPPQAPSPLQDTTIPSQPTSPEPMQLDLLDPPENVPEHTTLTTEASSQKIAPLVTIPGTMSSVESHKQEIPPLSPILQVSGTQSPFSTVNVEIPISISETPKAS